MKGYVQLQAEGWAFALVPELAEAAFVSWCSLPRGFCPAGVVAVVSSGNTEVRRFGHHGQNYFLKEYFFLGWKKHLKLFRRGERLVRVARLLSEHGFLTPRVVAFGRCRGNRRVVTEAVENVLDVWQVLFPDFKQHRGEVNDGFLHALGCEVGKFHRCGFFHGDLRWRNVLTRLDPDGWKFYFIDNDRTRRFKLGIPLHCRTKNLAQILFSGLLVNWPPSEWQMFLRGYFEHAGLPRASQSKLTCAVEAKARQRLAERRKGS